MRLTREDYAFWQSVGPVPKWAKAFAPEHPSIDRAINGHAGIREKDFMAHNALVILKSARARLGSVAQYFIHEYLPGWDSVNCPRRLAFFKKWSKRIPIVTPFQLMDQKAIFLAKKELKKLCAK